MNVMSLLISAQALNTSQQASQSAVDAMLKVRLLCNALKYKPWE